MHQHLIATELQWQPDSTMADNSEIANQMKSLLAQNKDTNPQPDKEIQGEKTEGGLTKEQVVSHSSRLKGNRIYFIHITLEL